MDTLYESRIARVRDNMEKEGLDVLLLSEWAALYYLTGESIHPGERLTVLLLEKDRASWVRNILFPLRHPEGFRDIPFGDGTDGVGILAGVLPERGTVGIDQAWPARFLLPLLERRSGLSFRIGSPAVDAARAVKDAEEIRRMKRASRINDEAMAEISAWVQPGMTEKETAEHLLQVYRDLGADGFSFPPIVSFGANGADPHHAPDDTVIGSRGALLFDMGCKAEGYCSDMTRTFFLGIPTEEEKEVHRIADEAGRIAEDMIRPGVPLRDIDRAAREHIAKAGYGECFTHRLGHFIGLREHEAGEVSESSDLTAAPGMIFSIEPGIYLPGKFGVRIEDLVLVTETGRDILNRAPRGWEKKSL